MAGFKIPPGTTRLKSSTYPMGQWGSAVGGQAVGFRFSIYSFRSQFEMYGLEFVTIPQSNLNQSHLVIPKLLVILCPLYAKISSVVGMELLLLFRQKLLHCTTYHERV